MFLFLALKLKQGDTRISEINAEDAVSVSQFNGYNISCCGEDDGYITINMSEISDLGTPPFTFKLVDLNDSDNSWSFNNVNSGSDNISFENLSEGLYNLEILDANYNESGNTENCAASYEITLTEPECLAIESTALLYECNYNVSCNGANDGKITAQASGGTENYTYTWFEIDENGNQTFLITGPSDTLSNVNDQL